MSTELKCRLCQCQVACFFSQTSTSIQKALLEHFSVEHKINMCDADLLDYLLVLHNLETTSGRGKAFYPGFIPKGKENVTPIKARHPLQKVKTNRVPLISTPLNQENLPSNSPRPNLVPEKEVRIDSSLLSKPNEWVDLADEKQFEICSSSICVISSVASAEQLSSSLIEEHQINNISNVSTSSENSSDGSDASWLSENNYEVINMRRLMTTAEKGRYICPNEECSFKCESKVLLNIHIRKRHQDMFGLPVKRQQMMIFLESVSTSSYVDVFRAEENQQLLEDSEIKNCEDQESKNVLEKENHKYLLLLNFTDDKDIPMITNIPKSLKRSYPAESKENFGNPTKKRKMNEVLEGTVIKEENLLDTINEIKKENIENQSKQYDEVREKTIHKMRFLQSGKSNGTYVQCSLETCSKWRYLEGYEDPSQIPDTWECSMNPNPLNNSCEKGASEEFVEGNEEFVDTKYASGSMVWAKMKGYPWWPALVDFCPDTDEYYWLDSWNEDESKNHPEADSKPSWYHVVFFDVPQIKRAWIKVEDIEKFESIDLPPKSSTTFKPALKIKWKKILAMASECFKLDREKRLEQFSFAALFDGKWGYYDENTKVVKGKSKLTLVNEDETEKIKEDQINLVGKPSDLISLWNNNLTAQKFNTDEWICDICTKYFPYVENVIVSHLKFHHMDVEEYLSKYSSSGGNNLGLIKWDQKKNLRELFHLETMKLNEDKAHSPFQTKIATKPPLEPVTLLAVSTKIFDRAEVTENDLTDLLKVIFPYFNQDNEKFKDILAKSKPALNERLDNIISSTLIDSQKGIKESLVFPGLIKRLDFERCHGIKKFEKPNCSEFLLCVLALKIIKKQATVNQIAILLSVIFPALLNNLQDFKASVEEVLSEEKEFVKSLELGVPYYRINSIEIRNTKKLLEDFVKNTHNHMQLQKAFF